MLKLMSRRLASLTVVSSLLVMTGCKSGNTSSVAEVPPPSSPSAITASPEVAPVGPQPVALKSNTPTTYNSYNTTPDTYTLGAPVAAPVAPPAAPIGVAGGNYVVRQGDTLWSISRAHYGTGQRWKDIIAANPGLTAERLPVGRAIVLP